MNGVYFGKIHSFDNLNLILAPFALTPAEPQTNFLKIPGRDGDLDLTEVNGEVKYNSREFTFPFAVAPGDELSFDERASLVSNALNGLRCRITLDRDPGYYWVGRCSVDKYTQDKRIGKIDVKATVEPYKLKQSATVKSIALSSAAQEVTFVNGRMASIPVIECTNNGTTVVFDGKTHTLNAGTSKILDIRFVEGSNVLKLSGTGTITFTWQEGAL
jgi:hypothetical protein